MNIVLKQKIYQSALSSIVFLVASLPSLYNESNKFVSASGSCPTYKSRLLHTLGFFALSILAMKYISKSDKSLQVLSKCALFGSLLFFIISSPEAYKFTNSIYSGLADESGCPTMTGLVVHTLLYGSALTGMMYIYPMEKDE